MIRRFTTADFPELLDGLRRPHHDAYYAMYSSMYGGIVTDPAMMLVPLDDHLVHRGDGVFEAVKCVAGAVYNLDRHLQRLEGSLATLQLAAPCAAEALTEIIRETVRAGGHADCSIHLYVSRGPGSFALNPYDCPATQLYVAVSRLPRRFMERCPEGARLQARAGRLTAAAGAAVKSCNYLPNMLLLKGALDAGADFVVGLDDDDCLTEGAGETVGIVTADRRLRFPELHTILPGTTMHRVRTLAAELIDAGELAALEFVPIPVAETATAAEILIFSTGHNVVAVREFNGRAVGDGRPGPVYERLAAGLLRDMLENDAVRTPVWS